MNKLPRPKHQLPNWLWPKQRGLTLVELLIAMTIGLVVLGAMSMAFVNSHSARGNIEKVARLSETGRFSLHTLTEDLRLAGFFGETAITATYPANPTEVLTNTAYYVCAATSAELSALIPIHVFGIHNAQNSSKPTCIPEAIKDNTDIIVVRRAATNSVTTAAALSNTYYFQASLCSSDGSQFVLSETAIDWTLKKRNCSDLANLREVVTRIYFVAANNSPGDGIPTLKRLQMVGTSWTTSPEVFPIADGVEEFQVLYGVDTDGNGNVESYVTAPTTVQNWRDVMTAKVSMLIRNAEKTRGYSDEAIMYTVGTKSIAGSGDGYKRHVFGATIEMRNPLGRREL